MADDLKKYIAKRENRSRGFAVLVAAAEQRRAFAREMAERRKKSGLSQTQIAARMHTSASIVSRLESGADVRISTLEKYMAALGMKLQLRGKPLRAKRRAGDAPRAKKAIG